MRVQPETVEFENPKGFIVFEGVNGAGKSTLLSSVSDQLRGLGKVPQVTREPGATELGKRVRELLMDSDPGSLTPLAELFLFSADRTQHVDTVIEPALKRLQPVLCDRFFYSTTAFQGYGRKLDLEQIHTINMIATRGLKPDLVILLDLDPQIGLERTQSRNATSGQAERDSFEEEELAFHVRLRDGFLKMADEFDEKFLVLDASKSQNELFRKTAEVIERWNQALNV